PVMPPRSPPSDKPVESIGPVTWALIHWNETLATALVKRSSSLESADCGAFYYAALTNSVSTLKALFDTGKASTDVVNDWGQSPFIAAAHQGNVEAVRFLLDRHVANVNDATSPHVEGSGGHPSFPVIRAGETALMVATATRQTEVVRLLLDRGADPN